MNIEQQADMVDMEFPDLNDAEQRQVVEFVKKIDLNNTKQVLNYGSSSQKELNQFSSEVLGKHSLKSMEGIGEDISMLTLKLKNVTGAGKEKGILGFIKKGQLMFQKKIIENSKVSKVVEDIEKNLAGHIDTLEENIQLLTKLEDMNIKHYKELTMYIQAGEKALATDPNNRNRYIFEKRITDLKLSRTLAASDAVQIRLIQGNNVGLIEKVRSSLNVVIPMWKTQLMISANLSSTNKAVRAQEEVTSITNAMIVKNAETLHGMVIDTAKAVEADIIDVSALKKATGEITHVFTEVAGIIEDHRTKRSNIDDELLQIENNIKATVNDSKAIADKTRNSELLIGYPD